MTAVARRDELGSVTPAVISLVRPKIRVLHIHSSQGLYGPERWTHLLLRTPCDGLHLEVLTLGTKPGYDAFARFLAADGHPARHLATSGKVRLATIAAIRRHIVERAIDIVHTHGFKSDVLGFLAARPLGVGLVTTPHGWCDHENLRIRMYEAVGRTFLYGFDRIYPLSTHQEAFLRRRRGLRDRVRLIRNAVDVTAFDDVYAYRRDTLPAAPSLLFVGRLGHEKGLFDLLRAFALLAARRPDATLRIVGAGPDGAAAEALAAELGIAASVELCGFTADVRPYLRNAAVLVLPSYSEGIPRVVMEAFAAGVPVVGTDIPGIREVVTDRVTGRLAPVRDPTRLAEVLEETLRDPTGARALAAAARARIEEAHAPSRLVDELREEYEALAARRRTV